MSRKELLTIVTTILFTRNEANVEDCVATADRIIEAAGRYKRPVRRKAEGYANIFAHLLDEGKQPAT